MRASTVSAAASASNGVERRGPGTTTCGADTSSRGSGRVPAALAVFCLRRATFGPLGSTPQLWCRASARSSARVARTSGAGGPCAAEQRHQRVQPWAAR